MSLPPNAPPHWSVVYRQPVEGGTRCHARSCACLMHYRTVLAETHVPIAGRWRVIAISVQPNRSPQAAARRAVYSSIIFSRPPGRVAAHRSSHVCSPAFAWRLHHGTRRPALTPAPAAGGGMVCATDGRPAMRGHVRNGQTFSPLPAESHIQSTTGQELLRRKSASVSRTLLHPSRWPSAERWSGRPLWVSSSVEPDALSAIAISRCSGTVG